MFGDRSGEGVLDRNHRGGNRAVFHPVEYFTRASARDDGASGYKLTRGLMTERAELSLDGDFHASKLSVRCGECNTVGGVLLNNERYRRVMMERSGIGIDREGVGPGRGARPVNWRCAAASPTTSR